MWRTLGFAVALLFSIWGVSLCSLSLFGCSPSPPKPTPPVSDNTEPPPPDDGSGGGSLDPFKGYEGVYDLNGTYTDTQAQIFTGLRLKISNILTSSIGVTLVKTVVCPVKRWLHGYGSYTGLPVNATLCLQDNGKISWQCGAGTICLPLPLRDGSMLSGGSGELAQKGVCQGPPTPLTNREGYRATLCQNNNDCPSAGETCADATDPPRRLALSFCSKTSTTTAGTDTEECGSVILKKR